MKSLKNYIQEKLIIKKNKTDGTKYFPKTKKELREIIEKRIEEEGDEVDLNDIDVSEITDMSNLFSRLNFNGDISEWDVSKVTDMKYMFKWCKYFNQDISTWHVSKVTDMESMFAECKNFNQDISSWDVSNVEYYDDVFKHCPIEDKYKPKFE